MRTSSDYVVTLSGGDTGDFDVSQLAAGFFAVNQVQLVNLSDAIATFSLGGGPTMSLLPYERLTIERSVSSVTCVSGGAIEVLFQI
jgi:hypothetical protein